MQILIHLVSLLLSFQTPENQVLNVTNCEQINTKIFNVQISVTQHIPYCGGATPSDEMLNRFVLVGGSYLLIDIETGTKTTVTADEDRMIRLNLPVGKYALRELKKDIPFEEFMQQFQGSNGNIIRGDEECYREFWKANLLQFEILPDSGLQVLNCGLFNDCYTSNPCDIYMGPYPS